MPRIRGKNWQAAAALLLLALLSAASSYQDGPQPRTVVRAYFSNPLMVSELAAWIEPWEVNRPEGYLVVGVTPTQARRMQQAGFRLEIDEERTQALEKLSSPNPSAIPLFPCYRTVEEIFASAASLVTQYPNLAQWNDIGDSWEKASNTSPGADLRVLVLTNQATPGPKPVVFIMASIHARELATSELALRFAELLLSQYGTNPDATWMLDTQEVHLLLVSNPDGRQQAQAGYLWRKNTNQNYCAPASYDRGADLNRNFSFMWGCCGGSSSQTCDETYRGPQPASEPETQAIEDYLRAHFADTRLPGLSEVASPTTQGLFIDLHSYGRLVLWPWGFTSGPAPNKAALQTLGRKLAYFNLYAAEQSDSLYPTDGDTTDFAYGELGVPAFTIELGYDFFESCTTFEGQILPTNLQALWYAVQTARAPYLYPAGPDTVSVDALPSVIANGEPLTITARFDDARFYSFTGIEPVQPVQSAIYSIDTPPWDPSAVSFSLAAVDGGFDTPQETARAVLSTATLEPGRHTLFVQAKDAAGNLGTTGSVFFEVAAPDDPLIVTQVRPAFARTPVAFHASLQPFSAQTPYTYTLSFGDGTSPFTSTVIGGSLSFTHTYALSGTYPLDVSFTNITMTNTITAALNVVVNPAPVFFPIVLVNSLSLARSHLSLTPRIFRITIIGTASETFSCRLGGRRRE